LLEAGQMTAARKAMTYLPAAQRPGEKPPPLAALPPDEQRLALQ